MYKPEIWGIANLPNGETVVHGESPEWEINTQAPPSTCLSEESVCPVLLCFCFSRWFLCVTALVFLELIL